MKHTVGGEFKQLKKIFNQYEEITNERLFNVCKNVNASVFAKVRLADVFLITNSGISNEEYSFALKSHFDFIVYDNATLLPLFAVEFDGKSHQTKTQKYRDDIKDRLTIGFNLPLLRINSRYLERKYRELDLLSWCVEVWFAAESFYAAQENGIIPYDEPFDPASIYSLSDNDKKFPFFLSYNIRKEFRELFNKKQIISPSPNTWIGTDKKGNYYGISWLYVDNNSGLVTTSGMRAQNFPVSQSELLEEIMIYNLHEQVLEFFDSKRNSVLNKRISNNIEEFESKYKLAFASFSSF